MRIKLNANKQRVKIGAALLLLIAEVLVAITVLVIVMW
jgi:hypothetical protein